MINNRKKDEKSARKKRNKDNDSDKSRIIDTRNLHYEVPEISGLIDYEMSIQVGKEYQHI